MDTQDDPAGIGEVKRWQSISTLAGTPGIDGDLAALLRLLIRLEATGDEQTLRAAGDELARIAGRFEAARDAWTVGYLAACRARVAMARERVHLASADSAEAEAAVDGAVIMALAHTDGPSLDELAEVTGFDLPAVSGSVARWERQGHVVVERSGGEPSIVRLSRSGEVPR